MPDVDRDLTPCELVSTHELQSGDLLLSVLGIFASFYWTEVIEVYGDNWFRISTPREGQYPHHFKPVPQLRLQHGLPREWADSFYPRQHYTELLRWHRLFLQAYLAEQGPQLDLWVPDSGQCSGA